MHDGGILANAVALSLVPAAVAGVLALGCPPLNSAGAGAAAHVAGGGATERGGVDRRDDGRLVGRDAGRSPWARAAPRRPGVAVAAGVAAVLLVPAVAPALGQARTASWPPDTGPVPFYQALGETLGFLYSGGIDPSRPAPRSGAAAARARRDRAVVALRRGVGPGRRPRVERDRRRCLAQPGRAPTP